MNTEIFTSDIIDMTGFDRRLTTLPSFVTALDKKKKALEYIEFAPKFLMSKQSVQDHYGIGIEEIKYLVEKVR